MCAGGCGKAKISQPMNIGKARTTSNGSRRAMGVAAPSSAYGKPKVRFSGRGR